MNKKMIFSIIAIIGIVLVFGYFIYIETDIDPQEQANRVIGQVRELPASIIESNIVGDYIELNKNTPALIQETVYVNEETGIELTENEFIKVANMSGNITEADIAKIKVEGGSLEGHSLSLTYRELEQDTYTQGTPAKFSGILKKVVPNSCIIVEGETKCKYISPSIFDYQFTIDCDYRKECNLITYTQFGTTYNDGSWQQKVVFTSTYGYNPGEYKISITANSEVINPDTQRPYNIELEKIIQII